MTLMKTSLLVLVLSACAGRAITPANTATTSMDARLEWKASSASDEVTVTLVVDGKPVSVGTLDGSSDDGVPALETCMIAKAQPAVSEFTCGATPMYNAFEAKLDGAQLVISKIERLDGDPDAKEQRKEVARVAVAVATRELVTTPYAGI